MTIWPDSWAISVILAYSDPGGGPSVARIYTVQVICWLLFAISTVTVILFSLCSWYFSGRIRIILPALILLTIHPRLWIYQIDADAGGELLVGSICLSSIITIYACVGLAVQYKRWDLTTKAPAGCSFRP
jgi:hypothetical protein